MTDAPRPSRSPEETEQVLLRARRGALLGFLLVVVLGGIHWIRDDHNLPLWIYVLLGGSFAWVLISMELLRRSVARKARQRGD